MTAPGPERLFRALDATWPAARTLAEGPWLLREGLGGGQRVSAATAEGPVAEVDIDRAECGMRALMQRPLFMIRPIDAALDAWLDARGYAIVDPVTLYLARAADLAERQPPGSAIPSWPPFAVQREIWEAGGVGPARIEVMARAQRKTTILGRSGDTPAGTAFVAVDGEVGMLHALEIASSARRQGLGARLMGAAADWLADAGAVWLTVAVTRANTGANALYRGLGMDPAAAYHYRRAPGAAP